MKPIFITGICLLIVHILFAQTRSRIQLTGSVTDARTGSPLAGASVILAASRNGTATDSLGHFILKNIPEGSSVVVIADKERFERMPRRFGMREVPGKLFRRDF